MTPTTELFRVFAPAGAVPDARAVEQLQTCMADERAVAGALMADHHLGYSMPIGGVIAYENAISPSGVGFDIACGNKAVRTPVVAAGAFDDVDQRSAFLREIQRRVAFGLGRKNATPIDHDLFDNELWPRIERDFPGLKAKAAAQLGTVGSGNHYVDLLKDDEGWLWIANHFGSRGFGHTIASGFLAAAAGRRFDERVPETDVPTVLPIDSELGAYYYEAMKLAGRYAYAGRDYVIDQVLDMIGRPGVTLEVHNHHNFAWYEDGLFYVRKGATPLTSESAFIGGSMGDISVIVRGTGIDVGALNSAPHGAGRVMSRTQAAGKWKKVTETRTRPDDTTYTYKSRVRDKSTAAIDWDAARGELLERGIPVLGAGADEAPGVYKQLRAVLDAHPNIEIEHVLEPIGVVMAGDDEIDPYKD